MKNFLFVTVTLILSLVIATHYITGNEAVKTEKVKVAILDSGINEEYLEFPVKDEFNIIDPKSPTHDEMDHGTPIASIIISSKIDLFDVKVLDKEGRGKPEDVIKSIEWCIEKEVDIINISFGYQTENLEVKTIIEEASAQGILIIAAAGYTFGFGVDFPAKYKDVLSITAVDSKLKRLSSSGKGKIDFSFEGEDISATDKSGYTESYSGTSFATANATKYIIDMMNEKEKSLSKEALIASLKKRAIDMGEKGYDREYGYGVIKNSN